MSRTDVFGKLPFSCNTENHCGFPVVMTLEMLNMAFLLTLVHKNVEKRFSSK